MTFYVLFALKNNIFSMVFIIFSPFVFEILAIFVVILLMCSSCYSLGNNPTLENIDGVIGYSYTCTDNGEVVVKYWVGCRGGV